MYFPYLRGRQNELIALRELISEDKLSKNIIPIIEPTKISSTLITTIEKFIENNQEIGFICNPSVGNFLNELYDSENNNSEELKELIKNNCVVKAVIMKEGCEETINRISELTEIEKKDLIVINDNRDNIHFYNEIFKEEIPKYNLIPDEFRRRINKERVLFEDRFEKCERNADYLENDDEFFSEDHIYYMDEGYVGFSDYSIIGSEYSESGFAPFAVAIHIVYFADDDMENKTLRVHHFVSDSNEDIRNPAKKFYEAVEKLNDWVGQKQIDKTKGLSEFLKHFKDESYPGLGSVKKLSLMHHLELMGNYLDEVQNK